MRHENDDMKKIYENLIVYENSRYLQKITTDASKQQISLLRANSTQRHVSSSGELRFIRVFHGTHALYFCKYLKSNVFSRDLRFLSYSFLGVSNMFILKKFLKMRWPMIECEGIKLERVCNVWKVYETFHHTLFLVEYKAGAFGNFIAKIKNFSTSMNEFSRI